MKLSLIQNWYVHFLLSILMIYTLIVYPFLNFHEYKSIKKHHQHHHACPCGCHGDMKQCMCEKSAGIVGFRFCTSEVYILLPTILLWNICNFDNSIIASRLKRGVIIFAFKEILKDQELYRSIEHPPKSFI